jgi:hypothetical protein
LIWNLCASDTLDPGADGDEEDVEEDEEEEEIYRNPIMVPLTTPLSFENLTLARSRPRQSYIATIDRGG